MSIEQKLTTCLNLQAKFNSQVNPDWQKAGYAWKRAMWAEAAELMDHLNYKWWKNVNHSGDRQQALLEVVDIFHFLLSDSIVNSGGMMEDNYNEKFFINSYEYSKKHVKPSAYKESSFQRIEDFVSDCVENRPPVKTFFNMMVALDFSFDEVIDYYLGKNALNLFRLDHGYKQGDYAKVWNGKEDNQVLDEILKTGERDFDTIYKLLNDQYMALFLN